MTNLRVFGSVARGQDRPDSDLDLLADLPPDMGLFGLGRVQADLEAIIGSRVDWCQPAISSPESVPAPAATWFPCAYRERHRLDDIQAAIDEIRSTCSEGICPMA